MIEISYEQYIREVELLSSNIISYNEYPFNLPAVRNLSVLSFHPNVTFIVGENGSGKSTLLEAIGVAYGFNPEGGTKNFNFSTADTHSGLYKYIKIVKGVKNLRTDSFTGRKLL